MRSRAEPRCEFQLHQGRWESRFLLTDWLDTGGSPIIVEVRPHCSAAEAAKRLRELADSFEQDGACRRLLDKMKAVIGNRRLREG
jgi:hypothetical protein